ncbi:hypothetical protein MACJ_000592 [Theileria orientalis]|uniref:UEV domain-containing protein n=1 Tax=Theileria orientalis TaxID=68886 RepID=A0A976M4B3_THEOR|nr:hypothetical protein MACJ_000592 [Theileria orientalis]
MDSELKSNLKKHFKNDSMVIIDLDVLHSKYTGLFSSLHTSPFGIHLNISGTVPYMFSGFVYKAPILIKIPKDYPFSAPVISVVPSQEIKIVKNHPNVDRKGNVTLDYLNKWHHTSKLVHAVDSLCKTFNMMSPIYSTSTRAILAEKRPIVEVTDQAIPDSLVSKYKLSDRDRKLVEYAYKNILTNLKNNRPNIIKQYNYDMDKYELHRKMLMNWVFALLDLNNVCLKLDQIEDSLNYELKEDELEKAEQMYKEVGEYVRTITSANQLLLSIKEGSNVIDFIKFKDMNSQRCYY